MSPRGLLLWGSLPLLACTSKVTEQGVLVDVANPNGVAGIAGLRVYVSNPTAHTALDFPAAGQSAPIKFPTSFSFTVPSRRSGEVDIAVDGMDAAHAIVAHGTASAVLQANAFAPASVSLVPGASLCGNLQRDPGETCDDGNRWSWDGCSFLCQSESGADAAIGNDATIGADAKSGGDAPGSTDNRESPVADAPTPDTALPDAALGAADVTVPDVPLESGGAGGAGGSDGRPADATLPEGGGAPGAGGRSGTGGVTGAGGTTSTGRPAGTGGG